MDTFKSFETQLYTVNELSFSDIALRLFRFQAEFNSVYRSFLSNLSIDVDAVGTIEQIPFLPISFFKSQDVRTGSWTPEVTFTSSGTTGVSTSHHQLPDLDFYLRHARYCFEYFYGSLEKYHLLALLPSYLERKGSSLIAMMEYFIRASGSSDSGFYLHDTKKLLKDLGRIDQTDRTVILWGVSFALLDLAESNATPLPDVMLFETGGMKGRRKEITRTELHETLQAAFQVGRVHSEYGMTELLSQAYSQGNQRFRCPPCMRIVGRDLTDPFAKGLQIETAGINVIDLANIYSVAFIETEDLGKVYPDGSFEVLGRADNSDVRGCNLLLG